MSVINPEKYIDILLKNKTYMTVAVSIIVGTAIFFVGRMTVNCPPKEVLCKQELTTIKDQFKEIEMCQSGCIDKLRKQRDLDEEECKQRIRKAIDDNRNTSTIVSCEEAKAIMPQCKRRGRWK